MPTVHFSFLEELLANMIFVSAEPKHGAPEGQPAEAQRTKGVKGDEPVGGVVKALVHRRNQGMTAVVEIPELEAMNAALRPKGKGEREEEREGEKEGEGGRKKGRGGGKRVGGAGDEFKGMEGGGGGSLRSCQAAK